MYRKLQDFLAAWKHESEATNKMFAALSDASLDRKVGTEDRTLGRIAWHITTTVPEMMGKTGLKVDGVSEDAPVPASAGVIADAYKAAAASLAEQVAKSWNDESLDVEDTMYGMQWKRGTTLGILIAHQTHHRGQMTVLMRQAGLKVPGVYGPAREEWSGMGMTAPEV